MDFYQQQAAMCYPAHMNLPAMMPTNMQIPSSRQLPIAMAYVPMQGWSQTYDPAVALQRGTVFPELDMPFMMIGGCKR